MKINELNGESVKLHARSITVLSDAGKTCGVIRNVRRFDEFQPRERFEFRKLLTESGLWESGEVDRVYADGGKLVYIHDLMADQNAERYGDKIPDFAARAARRNALKEKAIAAGVKVVSAFVC